MEGILREEYRSDMTLNDGVKLAVKCFVKDLKAREEETRLRIAAIPVETGRFTVFPEMQVNKYKKAI